MSADIVVPLDDPRPFHLHARSRVAAALVRGDSAYADALATHTGISLATGFLVAARKISAAASPAMPTSLERLPVPGPLLYRRDVLITVEEEHLIMLLPITGIVCRSKARSMAEQAMNHGSGQQVLAVAIAQAPRRQLVSQAVDEARSVLGAAQLLDYCDGIYQVDDVPIEIALMNSPEVANILARRLFPLYGSGAELFETLQVYLNSNQDRRQAARTLHIHPNTLDYRLRRIRELTGLSPTRPRDILTLGAALTACRIVDLERA